MSVVVKSCDCIVNFPSDIECTRSYNMEVRLEARGLLKAVMDPGCTFEATMVHRILSLIDHPNKRLQAKAMDLYTGVKEIRSALVSIEKLRCDSEFQAIWAQCQVSLTLLQLQANDDDPT